MAAESLTPFLEARASVLGSVFPGFSGDPNPYAGEPGAWECWNRVEPRQRYRVGEPRLPRQLVAERGINFEWRDHIMPALNTVGRLSQTTPLLRPVNDAVIDFRVIPGGRRYIEAAHVLAHWRHDTPARARTFFDDTYSLAAKVRDCVAEIALALLLDLPLALDRNSSGFPDLAAAVVSGRAFDCADAIVGDDHGFDVKSTAVVLCAGVFIEPLAIKVLQGLGGDSPRNAWCGLPSVVVFGGWETVDVVMGSGTYDRGYGSKPSICHGLSVMDLMPPCSVTGLRALAPEPSCGESMRMRVDDWLGSETYADMVSETPPICRGCTAVNMRADDTPERPRGRDPGRRQTNKHKPGSPWRPWHSAITESHAIVLGAWEAKDWRKSGSLSLYRKEQRLRKQRHRRRMTMLNKLRQYMRIANKAAVKAPTAAAAARYSRLKKELEEGGWL